MKQGVDRKISLLFSFMLLWCGGICHAAQQHAARLRVFAGQLSDVREILTHQEQYASLKDEVSKSLRSTVLELTTLLGAPLNENARLFAQSVQKQTQLFAQHAQDIQTISVLSLVDKARIIRVIEQYKEKVREIAKEIKEDPNILRKEVEGDIEEIEVIGKRVTTTYKLIAEKKLDEILTKIAKDIRTIPPDLFSKFFSQQQADNFAAHVEAVAERIRKKESISSDTLGKLQSYEENLLKTARKERSKSQEHGVELLESIVEELEKIHENIEQSDVPKRLQALASKFDPIPPFLLSPSFTPETVEERAKFLKEFAQNHAQLLQEEREFAQREREEEEQEEEQPKSPLQQKKDEFKANISIIQGFVRTEGQIQRAQKREERRDKTIGRKVLELSHDIKAFVDSIDQLETDQDITRAQEQLGQFAREFEELRDYFETRFFPEEQLDELIDQIDYAAIYLPQTKKEKKIRQDVKNVLQGSANVLSNFSKAANTLGHQSQEFAMLGREIEMVGQGFIDVPLMFQGRAVQTLPIDPSLKSELTQTLESEQSKKKQEIEDTWQDVLSLLRTFPREKRTEEVQKKVEDRKRARYIAARTPIVSFSLPFIGKKLTLAGVGGKKLELLRLGVYAQDVSELGAELLRGMADFYFYRHMNEARKEYVYRKLIEQAKTILPLLKEVEKEEVEATKEITKEKKEPPTKPSLFVRLFSRKERAKKLAQEKEKKKRLTELKKHIQKEHSFVGMNLFQHREVLPMFGYFLTDQVLDALQSSIGEVGGLSGEANQLQSIARDIMKDFMSGRKQKLEAHRKIAQLKELVLPKGEQLPAIPISWILRPFLRPQAALTGVILSLSHALVKGLLHRAGQFFGMKPIAYETQKFKKEHPYSAKLLKIIFGYGLFKVAERLLVFAVTMKFLDKLQVDTWQSYVLEHKEVLQELLQDYVTAKAAKKGEKLEVSLKDAQEHLRGFVERGHRFVTNTILGKLTGAPFFAWTSQLRGASRKAMLIIGTLFALPVAVTFAVTFGKLMHQVLRSKGVVP